MKTENGKRKTEIRNQKSEIRLSKGGNEARDVTS